MRRRQKVSSVDAERLASTDVDEWIEPAERVRLVEMVDEARRLSKIDPYGRPVLGRVAPAVLAAARVTEDRAAAGRLVERLVVAFRRSVAGGEYAAATKTPGHEVAERFGLGHVYRPHEDDRYWLAMNRIE